MTSEGSSCEPLFDEDPLPPEDHVEGEKWRSGLEALYRDRADRMIGHFASTWTDREAAREVVHEAFATLAGLSFSRRMAVIRPDAYLYRICVNLLRDRKRAQKTSEGHCAQSNQLSDWHNPFVELEHRDTLRRLETAMLRLNPKTREIFLAKRLDGMSYAEISERTGLSVKGIEKHMNKALKLLDRARDRDRL